MFSLLILDLTVIITLIETIVFVCGLSYNVCINYVGQSLFLLRIVVLNSPILYSNQYCHAMLLVHAFLYVIVCFLRCSFFFFENSRIVLVDNILFLIQVSGVTTSLVLSKMLQIKRLILLRLNQTKI